MDYSRKNIPDLNPKYQPVPITAPPATLSAQHVRLLSLHWLSARALHSVKVPVLWVRGGRRNKKKQETACPQTGERTNGDQEKRNEKKPRRVRVAGELENVERSFEEKKGWVKKGSQHR